jgi:hypothetical protein
MEKFRLSHLCLYAKGWYQKTNDIVKDLQTILSLHGFSGDLSKRDIASFMIGKCEKIDIFHFSTSQVVAGLEPYQTYRSGYVHNQTPRIFNRLDDKLEDYDYSLAIIYYCLSGLSMLDNEKWVREAPIYGKVLKKPEHITQSDIDSNFKDIIRDKKLNKILNGV